MPDMLIMLLLVMVIFSGLLILLYKRLWVSHERVKLDLQDALFSKKSLSTKYGKMTEQFIPFLDSYPYNEQDFRFIGSPIDGVQFEPDKVVLVEFKTAGSGMSKRQKEIKRLVEKGKVEFREFRLPESKE
jgi:predicted Holliday junction resolvase-like endonuclease